MKLCCPNAADVTADKNLSCNCELKSEWWPSMKSSSSSRQLSLRKNAGITVKEGGFSRP
jgi:hypothetical protein